MSPEARLITDEAVYREVGERFAADPQFRVRIRADAGGTLASLGIQVPEDVLVRVECEAPATERLMVYGAENHELTDADLEKVVGGVALPGNQLQRRVVFTAIVGYGERW